MIGTQEYRTLLEGGIPSTVETGDICKESPLVVGGDIGKSSSGK